MIACVDTHYFDDHATTGVVLFEDWADQRPVKTFHSANLAIPVTRGDSEKPLLVTAVGIAEAAIEIRNMHGPYRIPTLV